MSAVEQPSPIPDAVHTLVESGVIHEVPTLTDRQWQAIGEYATAYASLAPNQEAARISGLVATHQMIRDALGTR